MTGKPYDDGFFIDEFYICSVPGEVEFFYKVSIHRSGHAGYRVTLPRAVGECISDFIREKMRNETSWINVFNVAEKEEWAESND